MRPALALIAACLALMQSRAEATTDSGRGSLAVLDVENTTGAYGSFVAGLPDMIITELVMRTGENLVERSRIRQAVGELRLDQTGITRESTRRLGEWVGAERVLVGSLARVGAGCRLDLRLIEVASGRIVAAGAYHSREGEGMADLMPQAVAQLLPALAPKPSRGGLADSEAGEGGDRAELNRPGGRGAAPILKAWSAPSAPTAPVAAPRPDVQVQAAPVPAPPAPLRKPGRIRIDYSTTLTLLTERDVPVQRIRVYIDERLVAESRPIDKVNEQFTLFEGEAAEGSHLLRLEHGVVDRAGRWVRPLSAQPETVAFRCRSGTAATLKYKMMVNDFGFTFHGLSMREAAGAGVH